MSYEYGFVIARIWLSARLQDVCVYIYKCVSIYIYYNYSIHTHTYTYLYIYIYCVFLYRSYNNTYIHSAYLYVYVYIYIRTHTHIYIYIYPLVCSACPDLRSLASESVFFYLKAFKGIVCFTKSRTFKTMLSFFLPPL